MTRQNLLIYTAVRGSISGDNVARPPPGRDFRVRLTEVRLISTKPRLIRTSCGGLLTRVVN